MRPEQKLKHLILLKDAEMGGDELPAITQDNIDEVFDERGEEWRLQDATEEVRSGEYRTNIKSDWSRHYESDAVAAQYIDGSWVGWTYWHGGGKHGEPESVPWIEYAYDLTCEQEEKLVVVRTFARVAQAIEAQRAETTEIGSVHESAVGNADAPKGAS